MRLLPIPDASGKPTLWINADHLASVQPHYRRSVAGVEVAVELKVDGMPLQRIQLGDHADQEAAEAAFQSFLDVVQGDA